MFSTRMSRICVLKCRRKYTNGCKSAKRPSEEKPVRTRAAVLLRWLDIVFQGEYLPSLSVNCVAINKDLEKLTPQLY